MSRSARLGLVIYDTIVSDAGRVSAKVRTPHDNLFHKPYGGRQTPKRGEAVARPSNVHPCTIPARCARASCSRARAHNATPARSESWIALIHDCPAVMGQAMVFESGGYGPCSIQRHLLSPAAQRATLAQMARSMSTACEFEAAKHHVYSYVT